MQDKAVPKRCAFASKAKPGRCWFTGGWCRPSKACAERREESVGPTK